MTGRPCSPYNGEKGEHVYDLHPFHFISPHCYNLFSSFLSSYICSKVSLHEPKAFANGYMAKCSNLTFLIKHAVLPNSLPYNDFATSQCNSCTFEEDYTFLKLKTFAVTV